MTPRRPTRGWRVLLLLPLFLLLGPHWVGAASTLWQGERHGRTLFLMGSIHVLQAGHYPLPAAMEDAFQQSDLVIFEIDQQEMASAASQALLQAKGIYPPPDSLQQNIAPATFADLKKHLDRLKLPVALFQTMKPAYCALVLTMMEFQRLGFDAQYGLDSYFADKARRHHKKMAALETTEFQINLFFDLTAEDQEKFLRQTLLEVDTFARESERMSLAWQQGEVQTLHELMTASFRGFPDLYEKLIVRRNKTWQPLIAKMAAQHQTVLVVVGAGHLVGPHSLLRLLEKQGYRFKQL
jgi:hypothetical protein